MRPTFFYTGDEVMWPFSKQEPPDTRPPSIAALAIAKSLKDEPQRWAIGPYGDLLNHDSGITVDTEYGTIRKPWYWTEPDANEPVIRDAVDQWIAARLACPAELTPGKEIHE